MWTVIPAPVKAESVAEGPGDDTGKKVLSKKYCVEYVDSHPGPL